MTDTEPNMEQLDAAAAWSELTEWQGEPWEDSRPPWMRGDPPPRDGTAA